MLRDILNNLTLLRLLVYRDFKARYAGSVLGITWNVLHPFFLILVYILVFGKVMQSKTGSTGVAYSAYALHLCAGIVPWMMFAEVLSRSLHTVLENAGFVKKLQFPALILYLATLINALIINSISTLVLIGLLWAVGAPIGFSVVFSFALLTAVGLLALGLGLFLSVLNVYLRDIGQVVAIALNFGFWFVPIVYYLDMLPARFQTLLKYNPLLYFVAANQNLFSDKSVFFNPEDLLLVVMLPLVSVGFGYWFFTRHQYELVDEL
ncbi:MAG: ABC transporter permease [Candidatus Sumerlaeia bacterium]